MRAEDEEWDLSQASEFLLVAATLLELRRPGCPAAVPGRRGPRPHRGAGPALRPAAPVPRLQGGRPRETADSMAAAAHCSLPRRGGLEPRFAALLPDLIMTVTPDQLALIAARALEPKEPPSVGSTTCTSSWSASGTRPASSWRGSGGTACCRSVPSSPTPSRPWWSSLASSPSSALPRTRRHRRAGRGARGADRPLDR